MTDCKGCEHETECNYNKRYDFLFDWIVDYQTDKEYNSFKDISDLLNWQDEQIQDLKTRNNRQYERLKKLSDLLYKIDWKALEKIVEDWEESDRLLQAEWNNCGDVE